MTYDELIVNMLDAFNYEPSFPTMNQRMSAALNVAIEEFFKPISDKECNDYGEIADPTVAGSPFIFNACDFDGLLAERCSRYLKPKSAEERVTVEEVHTTPLNYSPDCAFTVMADGKPAGPLHSTRAYAETFRLGVIQQLKESK